MKAIPTMFEIYDEANELLAKVEMFDDTVANVEIKTVVTCDSFQELSSKILDCLKQMDLQP